MHKIYFDNAATTPVREEVIVKMKEALTNCYGNPSSTHGFGRSAKTEIEQARKTIAKYLNAEASEIIFTSGGTEADNMILRSAVRDLGVQTIITSKIEHHAVLHTSEALQKEFGIRVEFVDTDSFGDIDLKHLEQLLDADDSKKIVSLMHVNNEIGNILDMHKIALLCKAKGAYLHSDTVQSIGHFNWDLQSIPIDFLVASAHKFHGPKGVGFAFIRKNTGIEPLIVGGSQERGYRAGTEPFHNIVGLKEAFVAAYDNLDEEEEYISGLKRYFIEKLKDAIPGVKFNGYSGDMERSTYTLVNVCLPFSEDKSQMILFHMDLKGIACSEGSACQSGANGGSHVLNEILSDEELKMPSIRFSFSKYNTQEEVDYIIEALKEFSLS